MGQVSLRLFLKIFFLGVKTTYLTELKMVYWFHRQKNVKFQKTWASFDFRW